MHCAGIEDKPCIDWPQLCFASRTTTQKGRFMNFVKTSLGLLALLFATYAAADNAPTKVPYGFSRIYAPEGFDDNDNVQLVGEGSFPSSCYRYADTSVKVDPVTNIITLGVTAYEYKGACLQIVLPFDHTVDLGILKMGAYTVINEKDGKVMGKIHVRGATKSEPDDYLYAPITQAFFISQGASNQLYLSGDFPARCMKLNTVKFDVQESVLVVQPIAEVEDPATCIGDAYHFETLVNVGTMKSGRYLLHVRSMNARSVNSFISVP